MPNDERAPAGAQHGRGVAAEAHDVVEQEIEISVHGQCVAGTLFTPSRHPARSEAPPRAEPERPSLAPRPALAEPSATSASAARAEHDSLSRPGVLFVHGGGASREQDRARAR